MASPAALQEQLQAASADFQKIQAELATVVEARQKLEAQQSENELVKKEFAQLTDENTVYKLVGPVLVKQDQVEAKQNVDTRLDFIKSEIKRVEGQLKDLGEKSEKKKLEAGGNPGSPSANSGTRSCIIEPSHHSLLSQPYLATFPRPSTRSHPNLLIAHRWLPSDYRKADIT
ncbi:hypothetical protein FKP32DRAFT_1596888 [Trametes sanguinea]|nr:hypothetical protein FKP32DRAFT_1596888 [Trametes sanguinea]